MMPTKLFNCPIRDCIGDFLKPQPWGCRLYFITMDDNNKLPYQLASEESILRLKLSLYNADLYSINQQELLGRKQDDIISQCFHIHDCIVIFD